MTPGGKVQKGDVVRHVGSQRRYVVVKREGNSVDYSVILRPLDGRRLPVGAFEAFGYPGCVRSLEFAWWLKEGIYKFEGR